jgi:hypothetical protein
MEAKGAIERGMSAEVMVSKLIASEVCISDDVTQDEAHHKLDALVYSCSELCCCCCASTGKVTIQTVFQ